MEPPQIAVIAALAAFIAGLLVFLVKSLLSPKRADSVVRQALDDLKGENCSRAYIFSSSDFSRSACAFSENRQIELIGKEQLEQALKKSGI